MSERLLYSAIAREEDLEMRMQEQSVGNRELDDMSWFDINRDEITPLQPDLIRAEPYELPEEPVLDIIKRKYQEIKDYCFKKTGW